MTIFRMPCDVMFRPITTNDLKSDFIGFDQTSMQRFRYDSKNQTIINIDSGSTPVPAKNIVNSQKMILVDYSPITHNKLESVFYPERVTMQIYGRIFEVYQLDDRIPQRSGVWMDLAQFDYNPFLVEISKHLELDKSDLTGITGQIPPSPIKLSEMKAPRRIAKISHGDKVVFEDALILPT